MDMIKIAIFAVAAMILALQLRSSKSDYATYVCIAVGILLFSYALYRFRTIFTYFETLENTWSEYADYFSIIIKIMGITYVCEFSSGICRDSGFGQIAEQIELLGKLSIMLTGIPIVMTLIDTISKM